MPEQPEFELTTGDVARLLGVSISSVVRWADQGVLPSKKTPGGHWRFSTGDVEVFRNRPTEPEAAAS